MQPANTTRQALAQVARAQKKVSAREAEVERKPVNISYHSGKNRPASSQTIGDQERAVLHSQTAILNEGIICTVTYVLLDNCVKIVAFLLNKSEVATAIVPFPLIVMLIEAYLHYHKEEKEIQFDRRFRRFWESMTESCLRLYETADAQSERLVTTVIMTPDPRWTNLRSLKSSAGHHAYVVHEVSLRTVNDW